MYDNGQIVFEPIDEAKVLNNYCSSQWNPDDGTDAVPVLESKTNLKLGNFTVLEEEVLTMLRKLQVSKSGGPDNLPNKVLRLLAPFIAYPLTKLLNLSLSSSCLPDNWKEANVISLYKKTKSF